jgi:hypothetical protein
LDLGRKLETQPRSPQAAGAGVGGSGGRSGGLWEVKENEQPLQNRLLTSKEEAKNNMSM